MRGARRRRRFHVFNGRTGLRVYADLLLGLIERWVPMVYEAFMEYQMNAVTLSATALDLLRRMLQGERITLVGSRRSKREWDELVQTFHLRGSAD
jgi:thymidylate synthase (FAD)